MNRPPLSYLTAYLQFTIAVLFLLGYFGFLAILFLGRANVPDNLLELGKTLAVGLSGALGLLFAFLYLRSRVDSAPDPATTTITSSTEMVTTPSKPTGATNETTLPIEPPAAPPVHPDSLRDPEGQ